MKCHAFDLGTYAMQSSVASAIYTAEAVGWLRGPRFDSRFIAAPVFLALAIACVATAWPKTQDALVFSCAWLITYPHIFATYIRPGMFTDVGHKPGALWTSVIVVSALTAILSFAVSTSILLSIFLHWQWWHFVQQSAGIADRYRSQGSHAGQDHAFLHSMALYAVPVFGLIARSAEGPAIFLSSQVLWLPVPLSAVPVLGAIAGVVVTIWVGTQIGALWTRNLSRPYALFVAANMAMFYVSYVVLPDFVTGWIVISIWHGAQYLMLIWLENNDYFRDRLNRRAMVTSSLTRTGMGRYFVVFCLACSAYAFVIAFAIAEIFSVTTILFYAIQAHHHILDARGFSRSLVVAKE